MKKIFLMGLVMLVLTSCTVFEQPVTYTGEGEVNSETYSLSDFSSFQISNSFHVTIEKGDEYFVEVTTNENIFDVISVREEGNVLIAESTSENIHIQDTMVELKIICPDILKIDISNDSKVTVGKGFTSKNLELSLTNGANLKAEIDVSNSLTAKLSNDSNATFLSETQTHTLDLQMSNDAVFSANMKVTDVQIKLSNGATANLSGSGETISVKGSNSSIANLSDFEGTNADVNLSNDSICEINVLETINIDGSTSSVLKVHNGKIGDEELSDSAEIQYIED